jgi:hypothetical protein
MASLDQVLAELSARAAGAPGRISTKAGVSKMPAPDAPAAEATGITKETHDAEVAKARQEGHDAGVKAERERVNTILSCDEAKGREAQAVAMVKAGATADHAKALLATSPKQHSIATRAGADPLGGAVDDQPKPAAAMWGGHIEAHNKRVAAGRR